MSNFLLLNRVEKVEYDNTILIADNKEHRVINVTLRWCLGVCLVILFEVLYYTTQLSKENRVLRTNADKVIMRGCEILKQSKKQTAIMKFRAMNKYDQRKEINKQRNLRLKR